MRRLAAALALSAPLLAGCFAPALRMPRRLDPATGSILMSVTFKGDDFPYFLRHPAHELFFSKVLPDGSLDSVLVRSSWRAGDRQYALGLPPGRYALMAAAYYTGRARQLAKFNEAQARAWITTVKPGEIAFGGAVLLLRPYPGVGEGLLHAFKRAVAYLPPFRRAVIPVEFSLPRTDRSAGVELQALQLAREDLKGSDWAEAVEARLRFLGDPPPVITTGRGKKRKPVPPNRAERFTWQDTLQWGSPRKIAGGLEWRRPKTDAWISVAFVPKTGPDSRSLETEHRLMRESGAPEDRHTLTEVFVSSRPATAARYTTYVYPQASLVGSEVRILKTETLAVPDADGFYRLQYRAAPKEFDEHRKEFVWFTRYLDLQTPPPPEKEKK